jgi:hypothetical protein
MKDPDSSFGHFCVMLCWEPSLEATISAVKESESSVIHVVFPSLSFTPPEFERFASSVRGALLAEIPKPPVMAVFHPELPGDFSTSHRSVGLFRRAPDPFIQLIPEGLHEGGTVFIESIESLTLSSTDRTFTRLSQADKARIVANIEDIHADRAKSYAPFLAALRASS